MSSVDTLNFGDESNIGLVRTDEDLKEQNLSDVEKNVSTADDFIVYGKASIEQYDDDIISQKILMEAFEDALPQFFAQGGVISTGHKDVRVGEALQSYTLNEPTEITVGDDTYSFEEGEEIVTEVKDDELWLVANIYGKNDKAGSDASVATRLGAFYGNLDGFSVTIKNKAYRNTDSGQVVEDIDFHSVTIGKDDQIKNPGSEFDVAEFKLFNKIEKALTFNTEIMELNIFNKLRSGATENLAEETITHALKEGTYDLSKSAKQVSEDDASGVEEKATSKWKQAQEKADSREDLVSTLVDMTGLDSDEVNKAIDKMMPDEDGVGDEENTEDEMEDKGDMGKPEEDEEETDEKEMDEREIAQLVADTTGVTTGEALEAMNNLDEESDSDGMEEKSEKDSETGDSLSEEEVESLVESKMDNLRDDISEQVSEMEETVAEEVAESITGKMKTGSTPEPDSNPADEDTRNLLDEW